MLLVYTFALPYTLHPKDVAYCVSNLKQPPVYSTLLGLLSVDKSIKLLVCLLQIVVDENLVELGILGPRKLILRTCQALLDALLSLGAAAAQSLLELFGIRGRDEYVACVDGRGLDLLDALHLNVQHNNLALGCLLLDSGLARSVEVASELSTIGTQY